MPNLSLQKNSTGAIKPIAGGDTIPKDISPKINVIAWLEFEHVYYDIAVLLTGSPPPVRFSHGYFF